MFQTKKAAVFLQHAALCALASVSLLSSPQASANTPPKISGKPPTSIMVMHAYAFQPTASDADHNKLTFSISNKPWWASFSPTTGKLYGTPQHGATFSGVDICVSDGTHRTCLPAFALKVVPPTAPPTITGSPAATAKVGVTYSFQPTGHDPNGLPLHFGIWDKPSWLSFSAATGKLSGTPTAADVRKYGSIGITVSDGYHAAQLPAFSITVPSGGAALPPAAVTIAWTPPTENTNGSTLTNLAGYHIYYGTSQSDLTKVVDITNPGLASYVLATLSAGTWYFALTSINSQGVESARSAVVGTVVE
ncbi:MAG: putative Ig domain-containing protein [Steroidobacteraceae bacterium]